MKIAIGLEGLVVPHIVKIGDIEEWGDEETPYSFLVRLSGSAVDRIFAKTSQEAEAKRTELVAQVNRYYGDSLDI